MGDKKFYEKYSENGIEIHRVDRFQKNRRENFSIFQAIRYVSFEIFNPFIFIYTIYLILKHKIKFVHISTFNQISLSPLIAAKLLSRKAIVTLHSHELLCFYSMMFPDCYGIRSGRCGECMLKKHNISILMNKNSFLSNFLIGIVNYQIRFILFLKIKIVNYFSDKITFPSDYLREIYVKYGLKKEKTQTIYNFMELPKIDESRINQIKKSLKIKDQKIILFIGATIEEKGIKILLKSFEKVSKKSGNLKLILAGISYFSNKKDRFKIKPWLEDKVIFTGWINKKDKPNYYYISNIVVIPSIIPETFSLVFLEASLSKKIIIASDSGALSDQIIDSKNGFLVKPNDPKELAEKIEYVFENYDSLSLMRENAFLTAKEKYRPSKIIKEFIELYS